MCCFRAESLLKSYKRLQQQNFAAIYDTDRGTRIGRKPLDLLNRDIN